MHEARPDHVSLCAAHPSAVTRGSGTEKAILLTSRPARLRPALSVATSADPRAGLLNSQHLEVDGLPHLLSLI